MKKPILGVVVLIVSVSVQAMEKIEILPSFHDMQNTMNRQLSLIDAITQGNMEIAKSATARQGYRIILTNYQNSVIEYRPKPQEIKQDLEQLVHYSNTTHQHQTRAKALEVMLNLIVQQNLVFKVPIKNIIQGYDPALKLTIACQHYQFIINALNAPSADDYMKAIASSRDLATAMQSPLNSDSNVQRTGKEFLRNRALLLKALQNQDMEKAIESLKVAKSYPLMQPIDAYIENQLGHMNTLRRALNINSPRDSINLEEEKNPPIPKNHHSNKKKRCDKCGIM